MTKRSEAAFDNWWACLPSEERDALDEAASRKAFCAGFTVGAKPENKTFMFSVGKRRVTVQAPNYRSAKHKAEITIAKRFEAEGKLPPRSGWVLQPCSQRQPNQ